MVNRITISCLSAHALRVTPSTPLQEVVDRTIELWDQRLQAVLPDCPDIIVLPEAMDRPYAGDVSTEWQREYFQQRGSQVLDHLAEVAQRERCHLTYSSQYAVGEEELRNSTLILDRDGQVAGRYDKNFLVTAENTDLRLAYGQDPMVVDLDFGRVGAAICFDLNFTELLEAYRPLAPRLMVFSSEYHGGLMQGYWAYQLRSYFAGAIRPPAPSTVVSPLGEVVASSTNYFDHVTTRVNLDYEMVHLDSLFDKMAAMKAEYGPDLHIHDPGLLAPVLITSESDAFTAAEALKAYEVETLDNYLARSRGHRRDVLTSHHPRYDR